MVNLNNLRCRRGPTGMEGGHIAPTETIAGKVHRIVGEFLEKRSLTFPPEKVRAKLIESFRRDKNEGIETTAPLKLSLWDPISRSRIRIPMRSVNCRHFQCFDFATFLENTLKDEANANAWHCPMCNCPAKLEELFIDGFFMEILAKVGPEPLEVELLADGNWREVEQMDVKMVPFGGSDEITLVIPRKKANVEDLGNYSGSDRFAQITWKTLNDLLGIGEGESPVEAIRALKQQTLMMSKPVVGRVDFGGQTDRPFKKEVTHCGTQSEDLEFLKENNKTDFGCQAEVNTQTAKTQTSNEELIELENLRLEKLQFEKERLNFELEKLELIAERNKIAEREKETRKKLDSALQQIQKVNKEAASEREQFTSCLEVLRETEQKHASLVEQLATVQGDLKKLENEKADISRLLAVSKKENKSKEARLSGLLVELELKNKVILSMKKRETEINDLKCETENQKSLLEEKSRELDSLTLKRAQDLILITFLRGKIESQKKQMQSQTKDQDKIREMFVNAHSLSWQLQEEKNCLEGEIICLKEECENLKKRFEENPLLKDFTAKLLAQNQFNLEALNEKCEESEGLIAFYEGEFDNYEMIEHELVQMDRVYRKTSAMLYRERVENAKLREKVQSLEARSNQGNATKTSDNFHRRPPPSPKRVEEKILFEDEIIRLRQEGKEPESGAKYYSFDEKEREWKKRVYMKSSLKNDNGDISGAEEDLRRQQKHSELKNGEAQQKGQAVRRRPVISHIRDRSPHQIKVTYDLSSDIQPRSRLTGRVERRRIGQRPQLKNRITALRVFSRK